MLDAADDALEPKAIFARTPCPDALFMMAGCMEGDIATMMQINLSAPMQIIEHFKAPMQERRSGHIVILSSVAGDRGRASNGIYGSAKAGLSAYASALRNALDKASVHVMTVKPGFMDTPMTWGMTSPLIASREACARRIIRAMHQRKDVIYVPRIWAVIMLIIKHIPEAIFKRLSL